MADENFDIRLSVTSQDLEKVASLLRNIAELSHEVENIDLGKQIEREAQRGARALDQMGKSGKQAATGLKDGAKSAREMESNLPRLRYALYDVSSAFAIAGAAALGLSTAVFGVNIAMERSFADVVRTTETAGYAVNRLEKEFLELFTSMPVSWDALTEIGTLAGQLNIASADVAEFTRLVAMFAATTDVSTEAAATAFGRLAQLLGVTSDEYENMGSSILKVGVNSVATESQIIAISTQIAGLGRQANLTYDEVFALAASFASLGIAPELSRGTITRLFGQIERAIAGGNESLQSFAQISGMTAEQFASSWGTDSAGVLQSFLRGLGQIEQSGGSATAALREIGITSVRDVPALLRLSQSTEMVAENFRLTADGASEGTELMNQFGIIADTTAERITVLGNNVQALIKTLGESSTMLRPLIEVLNVLIRFATWIADNPLVSSLAGIVVVAGALGGALSLLVAGLARVGASMLAMRTATQMLGVQKASLSATISTVIMTLRGETVALDQTTAAMGRTGTASTSLAAKLGKGAGLLGVLLALQQVTQGVWDGFTQMAGQMSVAFGATFQTNHLVQQLGELEAVSDATFGKITDYITELALAQSDMQGLGDAWWNIFGGAQARGQAEELANQISRFDDALANLAKTNGPLAAVMLEQIKGSMEEAGLSTEQIAAAFPNAEQAILNFVSAAEEVPPAIDLIRDVISDFTGPIQDVYNLADAIETIGRVAVEAGIDSSAGFDAINAGINAVVAMSPENAANNLAAFYEFLINGAGVSAESLIFLSNIIASLGGSAAGATIDFSQFTNALNTGATSARRVGGAARSAAREVRTLVDYANDLAKVWNRAFDIRFGSTLAFDEITSAWRDLNEQMDEYRRKVDSLTADKAIKEYWLEVAEAYNDTLRAGVLRSEIADIEAEIADATAQSSTELNGNSKAAIVNRKRITDMVKGYQDYIEALAESGADQKTLNQAVERSRSEFMAQATALGYSTTQLRPYAAAFDDLSYAIRNVPKNVTVDATTDPAETALRELQASINRATNGGAGYTIPFKTTIDDSALRKFGRGSDLVQHLVRMHREMAEAFTRGQWGTMLAIGNKIAQMAGRLNSGGYAQGGYTGRGGKYELAGAVHRGEYVIPQEGVNQSTGLPYMSYVASLNNASKAPQSSYASGGFVNGSMTAMLDPVQMQQLINSGNNSGNNVIYVLADPVTVANLNTQGVQAQTRQGKLV